MPYLLLKEHNFLHGLPKFRRIYCTKDVQNLLKCKCAEKYASFSYDVRVSDDSLWMPITNDRHIFGLSLFHGPHTYTHRSTTASHKKSTNET